MIYYYCYCTNWSTSECRRQLAATWLKRKFIDRKWVSCGVRHAICPHRQSNEIIKKCARCRVDVHSKWHRRVRSTADAEKLKGIGDRWLVHRNYNRVSERNRFFVLFTPFDIFDPNSADLCCSQTTPDCLFIVNGLMMLDWYVSSAFAAKDKCQWTASVRGGSRFSSVLLLFEKNVHKSCVQQRCWMFFRER